MKKKNYEFQMDNWISEEKFAFIKDFCKDKETPFLVLDLDVIKAKFIELRTYFPIAKPYFAVKACPSDEVLKLLHELGSNFDVATVYELDQLLNLGVSPERMSYGNTIKKIKDIAYAYEKGIRLFVTDCEIDLRNLAQHAPGANVFFRVMTDNSGADWPLSRKFGSHPDVIYSLVLLARDLGLVPYGLSFHVGSQQRDIGQWDEAIARCYYIFNAAKECGIELKMINLGGGFPANYLTPTNPIEIYTQEIARYIQEDFGDNMPEIIIEPGRSLTADAGIIVSEVIMVAEKAKYNTNRFVFVDIGKFGGLIETIEESIKYPIYFDKEGMNEEVILCGPTCDSMDILYEDTKYPMPDTIEPGDRMYVFTAGSYTQSYSSVYFNGFPPLHTYFLPKNK